VQSEKYGNIVAPLYKFSQCGFQYSEWFFMVYSWFCSQGGDFVFFLCRFERGSERPKQEVVTSTHFNALDTERRQEQDKN